MADDMEQVLTDMQSQNQQLQVIMVQKQSLLIQDKEMEKALEEMQNSETEDIYKSIGPILVKTTKEKVRKELEENREEIEIKIKALENQERKVKEKIRLSQEKFQDMAKHAGQGG